MEALTRIEISATQLHWLGHRVQYPSKLTARTDGTNDDGGYDMHRQQYIYMCETYPRETLTVGTQGRKYLKRS